MTIILYGADADLRRWASQQLLGCTNGFDDTCKAIGIMDNGKLLGALIYSNYRTLPDGSPHSIEMSIAAIDKRWCSRHTLRAIFAYPFIQLGLERVQVTTSIFNEGVNSLVSRLGFVKEGFHRKACPFGGDAFSWSMLRDECRWIR